MPQSKPGWRSPTVGWMQLAGWLLLACFFIPVAEGCDGKSNVPVNILDSLDPSDLTSIIAVAAVLGAYANGVVWGLVSLVVGAFRSQRVFWAVFGLQCGLTLLGMLSLLVIEAIQGAWRDLLEVVVNGVPLVVFSIRQTLIWTTGLAVVIAYNQLIGKLMSG